MTMQDAENMAKNSREWILPARKETEEGQGVMIYTDILNLIDNMIAGQ